MSGNVEKVKKRKRRTDGSSKPSKRVAIEDDKQIRVSFSETGTWAPVIASTPGLAVPTSIHLKPYTKARKNVPSKSSSIIAKELILHSSEHPKLDYTAHEEESGWTDSLLKHYVGVYDPETGKMDVMEARKMVIRGSVRAQQAAAEDELSRDMRERRDILGQTFGTKKAKKAITSNTENAISPNKSARNKNNPAKFDPATAAILSGISETTKGMATRDELAQRAEDAKPRPKPNRDATQPQDVYTTDDLIGKDVMKAIPVKVWQDTVKANKELPVISRFAAGRLRGVILNVEKLKILRYMVLLMRVLGSTRLTRGVRMLPKRDELKQFLEDIPETVLESIKRKFTDAGTITSFQVDLIRTHLCALACIVDNFEVQTFDLMEDLKLDTKEMSQYFSEIGAKIVVLGESERRKQGLDKASAAQRKVAKLKIPLEFSKASFGRRK
ncbi:related to DNA-directed RNA polymerase A (I) chain [Rhynchosporium agropyri]|uniref:Related to DNA-directed RNA polymerase A (I) chain n=1 Tax=Rhynchosporium agropyri TaxID=914238 RepID=A0A1E1K6H8_9HELO|nr:related to DNA-directed RNA polymerase A (I) chain [Rhynchosporium agropyri]